MLRGGQDTIPLANAWVVLHKVTRERGGPVDSMRSDARGRYRIELRKPDSSGVYVVSVWYDSLAYFSLPLNVAGRPAVHVEDIVAFATSTNGPPIRLARRLVTVAAASEEGTREILEILELENTGRTTRITRDTLVPTWAGRVPEDAGQFRGGQGDISPEAMEAGIRWKWTTFREWLDVLDGLPKGINYSGYLGHSALRTYVMGERAFDQQASDDDMRRMEAELRDGLQAGAIGFTTSRSPSHETPDRRPVASRVADWSEVRRLVNVMGELNAGIFELAGENVDRSDKVFTSPRLVRFVEMEYAIPREHGPEAVCTYTGRGIRRATFTRTGKFSKF